MRNKLSFCRAIGQGMFLLVPLGRDVKFSFRAQNVFSRDVLLAVLVCPFLFFSLHPFSAEFDFLNFYPDRLSGTNGGVQDFSG